MKAVQSLPAHVIVEGLPKAVTSTFLKTTPGTLQELSTTNINLNSVDHKLVQALMPFQQEGVRWVLLMLMFWNYHIKKLTEKFASRIRAMKHVRQLVPQATLRFI